MADSRKKTGKADRARVSTKEKYEVAYEARKMGVSEADVIKAARKVGSLRKDIEAELIRSGKDKKERKKKVAKKAKKTVKKVKKVKTKKVKKAKKAKKKK